MEKHKYKLLINTCSKSLADIIIKEIRISRDIEFHKINDFTYEFYAQNNIIPELEQYVYEMEDSYYSTCKICDNEKIIFASYWCIIEAIADKVNPLYSVEINNHRFATVSSIEIKEFMDKLMKTVDCYDYNIIINKKKNI